MGSPSDISDPSEPEPYLLINRQRKYRIDRPRILAFLSRLTQDTAPRAPFSVVLVSDRSIQSYNRQFRAQDQVTDVLSFQGDEAYLGDILISVETASRQAGRSRVLTLERNLERLALHGLLHLMGYDHATDGGEMKSLELRLRRRFQC